MVERVKQDIVFVFLYQCQGKIRGRAFCMVLKRSEPVLLQFLFAYESAFAAGGTYSFIDDKTHNSCLKKNGNKQVVAVVK
jgi:hypothetical protein